MTEFRGLVYDPPELMSRGGQLGFFDSAVLGYEEQTKANSMFGLQRIMQRYDDDQAAALREFGVEEPPELGDVYFGAGLYEGLTDELDGRAAQKEVARQLREYDQRVLELRERHPQLGLMTSVEIAQRAATDSRRAEAIGQEFRTTELGDFGYFTGGLVGSMNPKTDPLYFVVSVGTLGYGTIAKVGGSAAARIGGAVLLDAGTEAAQLALGGLENRSAAGLEAGAEYAAFQIGLSGAFGGALQGVGEGVAYALRKSWRDDPSAPEPPRDRTPLEIRQDRETRAQTLAVDPPSAQAQSAGFGVTREARERWTADLREVHAALDDWNVGSGLQAVEAAGKRLRAAGRRAIQSGVPVDEVRREVARLADRVGPGVYNPEIAARDADPDLFAKYDKLVGEQEALQRVAQNSNSDAGKALIHRLESTRQALESERVRLDNTAEHGRRRRKGAEIRRRIGVLRQQLDEIAQEMTQRQVALPDQIAEQIEFRKRQRAKLAPLIERAYARSRAEIVVSAEARLDAREFLRGVGERLSEIPAGTPAARSAAAPTPGPTADAGGGPDGPSGPPSSGRAPRNGEEADADAQTNLTALETMADGMRGYARALNAAEGVDDAQIALPPGVTEAMLDTRLDSAGLTLRQTLEQQREVEAILEAVSVCKVG